MKKFLQGFFGVLLAGGLFAAVSLNFESREIFKNPEASKAVVAAGGGFATPAAISVLNFGDTMFARGVASKMQKGIDPFQFVSPDDWRAFGAPTPDLVLANLEGPISDYQKCQQKPYSFKFATSTAEFLANHNFNLVNLANNHSFDCLAQGLADTRKYLDEAGVGSFGGGALADSFLVKEIGGKKIAFVGIDDSGFSAPLEKFSELVGKLKTTNDFVIVDIHWGIEYAKSPMDRQKDFGHKLIDAGADVVVGHHPHVIEPVEIWSGKPIFYSFGNFVFDQIGEEQNRGIAVKIIFGAQGENHFQIFPYKIIASQPQLLDEPNSADFCASFLKDVPNATICSF